MDNSVLEDNERSLLSSPNASNIMKQSIPPTSTPTNPNVSFGNVRASSTPSGMVDRIPPRVVQTININVSGWSPPMAPVEISIEKANANNGTATVNGSNTVQVATTGNINLLGQTQTQPGNAGKLRLVAKIGSTIIANSNYFSIAAIPQNWQITFNSLVTGTRRGIRVNNNWESDSGNLADLDQVQRSEKVQYNSGTGVFSSVTSGNNSGFLPGNNAPRVDSHSVPVSMLTGVGNISANQLFIFKDARTGANNIPAKNSGFVITRDVTQDSSGNLNITTSKVGQATNSHGYSATGGTGNISRSQNV